jgi:hypothetical protein
MSTGPFEISLDGPFWHPPLNGFLILAEEPPISQAFLFILIYTWGCSPLGLFGVVVHAPAREVLSSRAMLLDPPAQAFLASKADCPP